MRDALREVFHRLACAGTITAMVLGAACGTTTDHEPLADEGARYAGEASISRSSYNAFSCDDCHAAHPGDVGGRILSGAVLEGVALRPSYWGGETDSLTEAVQRCWTHFMRGQSQDLDGPVGDALFAWLTSLAPTDPTETQAVPVTWVSSVADIAPGDATQGNLLYHQACSVCHGELNQGPVLGPLTSYIPADTVRLHDVPGMCVPGMCGAYVREVVIEKVRHGSFLGYSGNMAPFSSQSLTDAQLADILAYMNLPNN